MVTDAQVRRLKRLSKTETKELAAAKAGMDVKTARKYLADGRLPRETKPERNWRTRGDPFERVWDEIREQIRINPGLEAKTIFEALQRQHPDEFADGQLRTLQRRIKGWRATEGPGQEVFFAQQHVPGRLGQSDFTSMNEVGVTIGGQSFPHLLYHFVLTYSNWEDVTVCYSESFESLSEGLQNALWELGGAPLSHRTDRMSTAVNNMTDEKEFTTRYEALLRHYRMQGQKIQARKANQNGDIEQRHHRLKRALAQALLLRGSHDFTSVAEYRQFLRELLKQLNAGRRERLQAEMQYLKALPERRLESLKRVRVKVDSGSLIYADRNTYSVNSRLIGEEVEARLGLETVEVWYAGRQMEVLPRLRGRGKHRVDYRTSSIGWCASRARLKTTAIAKSCFLPAASAWLGTRCGNWRPPVPTRRIWKSCIWPRKRERRVWMTLCARCWSRARSARGSSTRKPFRHCWRWIPTCRP